MLEKRVGLDGPRNDDELWEWIRVNIGIEIPRVAVCDDHQAPFEFLADLYFERKTSAVLIANRSGSKTYSVAILHLVNSLYKAGIESATIGAIEMQAKRAYMHLNNLLDKYGRDAVSHSTITETRFKNGARLEVLPGCLPNGARVITKDGPMRIDQIVSKKLPVEVKSFNFQNRQWEWKKVINWFNNGKTDQWLSMKLDINCKGISQLTATPGHQVLRPDGTKACFVDFKPGDEVLVPADFLSEEQEHSFESARTAKIVDIWPVKKSSRRYDITVEDNHNYCTATGVLISNTLNAVNGPHPQVVHFDEVELADPQVFDESRNMSSSKKLPNRTYISQDIITSTRKRANGPMQKLVNEIKDAEKQGLEPPYSLFTWCIFECAEEAKNCQVAYPDLPDCDKCRCDKIAKGVWDDESPRTLKDVCGGKFAKSRGWQPFEDVVNTFTKTSRGVFEAQQQCIRPSTSDLVLPGFKLEKHGIKGYRPDPLNGPIYEGIDFGGKNPHCVEFFQVLEHEVEAQSIYGKTIRLPQGARVMFDEIYKAGIGNGRLAELIAEREARWHNVFPGFVVRGRFADPQGRAARLDLARAAIPIKTQWRTNRDVKEHIKIMNELIEDSMFYVDTTRCVMWCEEVESWHYPRKNASFEDDPEMPVKDFDHAMDSSRYGIANISALDSTNNSSGSYSAPISKAKSGIQLPQSSKSVSDTNWMKQFAPVSRH